MNWDESVDVLVVGTGAGGCAAGASAAKHLPPGSKVLICETSLKMVGGTTKLAGGGWLWVPNNPFLQELGIRQNPEEIKELLKDLAYPDGQKVEACDAELFDVFAEEWPGVLKTIVDDGVMKLRPVDVREREDGERVLRLLRRKQKDNPDLAERVGINESNIEKLAQLMPSYCAEHPMDLCPSGKVLSPDGSTTSLQLEKACRNLYGKKCEIRMDSRVVDVVFDKFGRVVGAIVVSSDGKTRKRIQAKGGVIFASGGFAQNQNLMNQHFGGQSNAPFGSCSAKTNVGDFIDIATRHNIPISAMDTAWMKQCVLPYKFPKRLGVFFMNGDSYMVVDRTGKRFACDRDFYQQRGMQMYNNPARRCVFFVFDERSWTNCEGPIKGLGSAYPNLEENEDCMIRGKNEQELTQGIEAMLQRVCPDFKLEGDFAINLKAQIGRFNEMAKTGKDIEFGRGDNAAQYCWSVPRAKDNNYPNKTMYPLDQAKLCCVVMGLATLDTKGGPTIDRRARVLGVNQKPIPGLYGAGNAVRSSTRHSYPASGVTLSNAILFGWLAGKDAALNAYVANAKL